MSLEDRVLGRQQWLCSHLRETRMGMGFTLSQVSERMGVSISRVSDMEAGYYDMKMSSFLRYLDALGIPLHSFSRQMPDDCRPDKSKLKSQAERRKQKVERNAKAFKKAVAAEAAKKSKGR